MINWISYTNY